MLTCQRTNVAGAQFYQACKYSIDAISPSKVDPMAAEDDYNHVGGSARVTEPRLHVSLTLVACPDMQEIFSKLWDDKTKATLAQRGAAAAAMWAAEHDGRLQREGAVC